VPARKAQAASTRKALILTALGLETKAVLSHLSQRRETEPVRGTIFHEGVFKGGAAEWQVRVAEAGAGNVPSAVTAERAIADFKPSLAIFVGVAGGIKDVELGDVVIASHIYGYERGRLNAS
jgi:nucleoside phosphorylase